jgi:perosamine synthetase
MKPVPFSKKNITDKDIKIVNKILKSGWLTHGKNTAKFENEFKKYTKSKYAVTVSSCTAGLHLACQALGFKKGDEVIVPAITHVATAHAVSYCGATPIMTDINLYNGSINLGDLKKKINKKTKGIIVVHMAGFSNNMDEILKVCKKYKLKLIEDCAHCLGSTYKGKHLGNFGDAGVFSFYPTKQISIGEGGMVITNKKSIFNTIRKNKAFGIDKDISERKIPGLYDVKTLGYNYRMTDYQSAIGHAQILRYRKELIKRKANAVNYHTYLKNIDFIKLPKYDSNCSYFIFQIFVKKSKRGKVMKALTNNRIGFSIHYAKPINKMSYYFKKNKISCKNAKIYSDENISLPVHSGLNKTIIKKISQIISTI